MKKRDHLERTAKLTEFHRNMLLFLFLLSVWFFGHPYQGIWHDGLLYTAQALHRNHPEIYGNDLFFLYGSQDEFTIFTPIYATLINFIGLNSATITLLLANFALWIAAAMLLVGSLMHGVSFWLALTLIFALSGIYIPNSGLSYGEPFLTARLPAESFTLISLAMMLRRKWIYSFTAMLAAFSLHPLMAFGGGALVSLYVLRGNWKWAILLAAAGFMLAGIFAFADVSPFDRIFHIMDSQWYQLAVPHFYNVSPQDLTLEHWNPTLFSLSLLSVAAFTSAGRLRQVLSLALIVGLGGIALTVISTLFFHDLLLIQLQPWRALWITKLISCIAAAWLLSEFWPRNETYRLLLLGFLTAWFTLTTIGGILSLLVCVSFIGYAHSRKDLEIPRYWALIVYFLLFLTGAWWLFTSWLGSSIYVWEGSLNAPSSPTVWFIWFANTSGPIAAIAIFLQVWRHATDHRKHMHLMTVAIVLLLLGFALVFWDRRSVQERYYEQTALHDPIPSFSRLIPKNSTVYWEDNVKMAWLVLHRANYASLPQSFGRVFSRQTAIEAKRRMDRLAALRVTDSKFHFDVRNASNHVHLAKFDDLLYVCRDPLLDFVILTVDLGEGMIERYFDNKSGKNYYLYKCTELRQQFADRQENQHPRPFVL